MILQKWTAGEIFFTSNDFYGNPFMEVDLNVTFTNENGEKLVRPAFWLGENKWCVRFAPTTLGKWSYITACSNRADSGLHDVKGEITCVEYEGDLEIYKRGFIKVSENKRFFTYADGTPFYYLGDTHWLMNSEPLENSNVEGIDSAFKFIVDYRISQGFTVYQSQPLGITFENGFREKEVEKFESFDKKFKYIAQKGLLHANSQITFALKINGGEYTPEFLIKMAKMWVARFGAYPVLWTTAQECDPDHYGKLDIAKWPLVAETLYLNDCYKHPLTGHMCNCSGCNSKTTIFGNKYYHSWFGMQPDFNAEHFEDFYNYPQTKPLVVYETGYEGLWSNKFLAYNINYYGIFAGACGYGYGAHGVWYFNHDTSKWWDYGGYIHWFEGVKQEGAKKLVIAKNFFKSMDWWNIVPHHHNKEYWSAPINDSIYATLHNHTHFIFEHTAIKSDYTLYKVENGVYSLLCFEPEKDIFSDFGSIEASDGSAYIPKFSDITDATILILTKKPEIFKNPPLDIKTENHESMLTFRGDTLTLVTNKPCTFTVDDETVATLEGNILTAQGKNGTVTVTATSRNEVAVRKFVAVRQDKNQVAGPPETITPVCPDGNVLKPQTSNIRIVPKFTPENYWEQTAKMEAVDENGNKSKKVIIVENFGINPICDGDVYIRFVDWLGNAHKPKKFTIEGYGEPSLTLDATATSSDFHPEYDHRGLPQRALSGSTARFTGWASSQKCSFENPVSLIISFNAPSYINNIRLHLTDLRYTLKSFDVVIENENKMTTIKEFRDNTEFVVDINFEKILTEKIHIICYKGDGEDYARIDQVNAYLK